MREIPGTTMLISCIHKCFKAATFGVFDVSKRGRVQSVYTFEEACGAGTGSMTLQIISAYLISTEVGQGDIAVNVNRKLIALIPQMGKVAYHLFQFQNNGEKTELLLMRKAKWIKGSDGRNT